MQLLNHNFIPELDWTYGIPTPIPHAYILLIRGLAQNWPTVNDIKMLSDMHWTPDNLWDYLVRGCVWERKFQSESLQTFSGVSPASPLVKTPDDVWMSPSENKAGAPPEDLPRASVCVDDVLNTPWTEKYIKRAFDKGQHQCWCAVNKNTWFKIEVASCLCPLTWMPCRSLSCLSCVSNMMLHQNIHCHYSSTVKCNI